MRSILRSTLIALAVTVALGAVAATSASAYEFVVNGEPIPAGTKVPFVSKNSSVELEFAGAKIVCSTVRDEGYLLAKGESTSTVEFKGCTSLITHCTVAEPIVFNTTNQLLSFGAGELADRFSPNPMNGPLFNFKLMSSGGTCSLAGSWSVAGTAQALMDNNEEERVTEKLTHTLTFNGGSGSNLEVGGISLSLHLKGTLELEGAYWGKTWSTKTSPSSPEFKVGGAPIAEGARIPFESKNVASTVVSLTKVGGGLKIECTTGTVKGSGELLSGGGSTYGLELTGCTTSQPEHCKVAEPIVFKGTDQLVLFESKPADTFYPETGTKFTELELSSSGGSCSLAGKIPVTGTAQALVETAETEAPEHTLFFSLSSGSKLEVEGSEAVFKLKDAVKLSGAYAGDEWDVS